MNVAGLINANLLGAGLEAEVPPGAVAVGFRVSAMTAWATAAVAARGLAAGAGTFGDLPPQTNSPTPVAASWAAADTGEWRGYYPCGSLARVRLEPTTVETAGASPAPVYLWGEIVFVMGDAKLGV